MRAKVRTGREAMLGKKGVVIQDIDPEGKIQYAAEIWNAIAKGNKFSEGENVIISGFSGMRVVVAKKLVE